VVLATGGMGQVFAATTNPAVSTGDGLALALRAGAVVTDVEFVQFHPTALAATVAGTGGTAAGQLPLVSEALRGEGAYLVDSEGKRFLVGQHELAELAPRDVVAKAIHRVMRAGGLDHVWLDARHLGTGFLRRRFPTIVGYCRAAGIEPGEQLIPVAPAAHYASGGVRTDLYGRTSVAGLYACGEVACTGVHGANRLASNSLLEGLVFARRIAADLARRLPAAAEPDPGATSADEPDPGATPAGGPDGAPSAEPAHAARAAQLRRAMGAGAGVLRSAASLAGTAAALRDIGAAPPQPGTAGWELVNLLTVASAVVGAAYARRETRGSHWREDWPDADDAWLGHLCGAIAPDGLLTRTWLPAPATAT
jgi:L-aspartate oxidase